MLCTHKTASSASLVLEICHQFTNSFLHQFSSIFGGNCINGERHRAKVTRKLVEIIDHENGHRVENIKFILVIGNGKVEELISYNQLLEHLETAQDFELGMDQELFKSEPSLDTKVLWQQQIQIGRAANTMFKWNGRLGRILLNPLCDCC